MDLPCEDESNVCQSANAVAGTPLSGASPLPPFDRFSVLQAGERD